MNHQPFKKRSNKLLDQIRANTSQIELLIKQIPDLLSLSANCNELSSFLSEIYKKYPNFARDLAKYNNYLEQFILNTPVQYLGYIRQYLKVDIMKAKCTEKKFAIQILFYQDFETLQLSREKAQVIKNVSYKIQLIYEIVSFYRKLKPLQALRWIGFIDLSSSVSKQIFSDLIKIIRAEFLKIRWQQITQFLNPSIPTRGNYGVMIGFINKNHQEIADEFNRMIKNTSHFQIFLQALLTDCLAPNTLKVVAFIIKKVFDRGQIAYVNSFFDNIAKPLLIPNLQKSKFYKGIEQVMRTTLVKFKQECYPLKEKDVIPRELNKQYSVQHYNLLLAIINFWVKPTERSASQLKLQRIAPPQRQIIRKKESQLPSRIPQPTRQIPKFDGNARTQQQKQQQYSQFPTKQMMNSQKVQASNQISSSYDSNKIIMFECQDYIGLPNVGNTCYMNSFIQNLLFCKDFLNVFMGQNLVKYKIYQILKKILQQLKQQNKSNLKPLLLQFKKQLPTTFSIDDAQQDSMQFGRQLINGMTSVPELKEFIKKVFLTKTEMITKCPEGDVSSRMQQLNSEMILTFEHPSIISKLKSDTKILPIKMEDLMNAYFADNFIEGQFKCDKCKKKFKSCQRQIQLVELPQILIIVLSRFMYDISLHKKRKILDVVNIEDYIHFGNINTHSKIKSQYKLTSFVVHLGNQAQSGHYQVYAKHPKQKDCWIIFDDDNSVMQVTCGSAKQLAKNLAVEESPYILFYTRM